MEPETEKRSWSVLGALYTLTILGASRTAGWMRASALSSSLPRRVVHVRVVHVSKEPPLPSPSPICWDSGTSPSYSEKETAEDLCRDKLQMATCLALALVSMRPLPIKGLDLAQVRFWLRARCDLQWPPHWPLLRLTFIWWMLVCFITCQVLMKYVV